MFRCFTFPVYVQKPSGFRMWGKTPVVFKGFVVFVAQPVKLFLLVYVLFFI